MTITREHLELAALAAGLSVAVGYVPAHDDLTAVALESGEEWRPHLDDGEAMRLAVRLNMDVGVYRSHVSATPGTLTTWVRPPHDGTEPDKLRAWREAVVLCAAAVGERMRGER
jgi:hypothetical protein